MGGTKWEAGNLRRLGSGVALWDALLKAETVRDAARHEVHEVVRTAVRRYPEIRQVRVLEVKAKKPRDNVDGGRISVEG